MSIGVGAGLTKSANLQAVERALELLQHIVLKEQAVGTRESARLLGISPSAAHRLLKTLVDLEFLEQDPATSEFYPGLGLYRMAATLLATNTLGQSARQPMEKLATQTGEAVCLCVRRGGNRMVLDTVPGWRQLRYALPLGNEVPLHVGSSGLAILAWLPDDEFEAFLQAGLVAYSPRTLTDPDELRKTLETIREQGYASSIGHHIDDGMGVSAPIFYPHGEVVGSLLLTIPLSRMEEHGPIAELGQLVRGMADDISLRLGGRPLGSIDGRR